MSVEQSREAQRLALLNSLDILDTNPEEAFDDLTRIASVICDVPICAISFVDQDRQWFKSKIGLSVDQTPRNVAFCSHAIEKTSEVLMVEDAQQDQRFATNPLVTDDPKIRFYAGAPLISDDGLALGTVCVIDTKPRTLSQDQLQALQALARRTVTQLKIRSTNHELSNRNDELSQFAFRVSHDFKAPLSSSKRLAEFLLEDLNAGEIEEAKTNARRIHGQMESLEKLVADLLNLARADLAEYGIETIDVSDFVDSVIADIKAHDPNGLPDVQFRLNISPGLRGATSTTRLAQILRNLVSNSLKYRNPAETNPFVDVSWQQSDYCHEIVVADNGLGIPPEYHARVGQLFTRFHPGSATGSGLGLSIVYKHIKALNGSITFTSDHTGTRFKLQIPVTAQPGQTHEKDNIGAVK